MFAKNERGYRLKAKNKRFWSLLILLISDASIRRKLLKTNYTVKRSAHTNSESCNIQLWKIQTRPSDIQNGDSKKNKWEIQQSLTSCGGTSKFWTLISIFSYISTQGIIKKTPGPRAPPDRSRPDIETQ